MRTVLFTQSYRDSGFENLVPMGIAYMDCYSESGRKGMIKRIREDLEKQGIEFVFNCKFEFWFSGHPNNGNYGGYLLGDAYKMPKDFKEQCDNQQDTNELQTKKKSTIKKGWQFRCGLVTIDQETLG